MPGLLQLKYMHLHERRQMTKEVARPGAASVSAVTLTLQTKDCESSSSSRLPSPMCACVYVCGGKTVGGGCGLGCRRPESGHLIPCFSIHDLMPLDFTE